MKVGIAGTGKIVREFLNMQKDQERIEVTALVCLPQSEKTGRELAEQYGIPALYRITEPFFIGMNNMYSRSLQVVLRHRIYGL